MTLTIPVWPSKWRGGYYWHVPDTHVRWSSDIGTATREALELAESMNPGLADINFHLTAGL
jgi:hypothetical protein